MKMTQSQHCLGDNCYLWYSRARTVSVFLVWNCRINLQHHAHKCLFMVCIQFLHLPLWSINWRDTNVFLSWFFFFFNYCFVGTYKHPNTIFPWNCPIRVTSQLRLPTALVPLKSFSSKIVSRILNNKAIPDALWVALKKNYFDQRKEL